MGDLIGAGRTRLGNVFGSELHTTPQSKREELRFLFGSVAIAKQRPSSPPIMLSPQRMVSNARRFAAFRAYSNPAPSDNGTE